MHKVALDAYTSTLHYRLTDRPKTRTVELSNCRRCRRCRKHWFDTFDTTSTLGSHWCCQSAVEDVSLQPWMILNDPALAVALLPKSRNYHLHPCFHCSKQGQTRCTWVLGWAQCSAKAAIHLNRSILKQVKWPQARWHELHAVVSIFCAKTPLVISSRTWGYK